MAHHDTAGRSLADYPRPSVAVDAAVLSVVDDALSVALVADEAGDWRLPGTFLHEGETLADAVRRALRAKAGVEGLSPRQLYVFDDPDRDERGWVLSVAHVDVLRADRVTLAPERARFEPIASLGELAFDHSAIVALATDALRAEYSDSPDPRHLLDEPFTMLTLRRLHEAIAGGPLMRDAFRRAMEPRLVATSEVEKGVVGKPARLYRRIASST